MKPFRFLLSFVAVAAIVACGSDSGSGSAPDIPDDPDGTKKISLSYGGEPLYLDDTGNAVALDNEGHLQGENVFFATSGKCDGISYIKRITTAGWDVKSAQLRAGYGYVMGSKTYDGATFTALYVDEADSVTRNVKLKSISPFYGDGTKFSFNHYSDGEPNKRMLYFYKEAGDTTVVIIKPTTYNVELAVGKWMSVTPHITYVRLNYTRNNSGAVRTDTLIFSNGKFVDARVPVTQLHVSLSDSIFPFGI